MKEDLTREVLEAMMKCNETKCRECAANGYCSKYNETMASLAAALLEERAKPKDDVWKFAPKDASVDEVYFGNKQVVSATPDHTYNRELPKTRARQIAEQEGQGLAKKCGWSVAAGALVVNRMEVALNKYAEELKGEA